MGPLDQNASFYFGQIDPVPYTEKETSDLRLRVLMKFESRVEPAVHPQVESKN